MSFSVLLLKAWEAYRGNARLISFFSIPLLIAFPLLLLLPNYTALGGVFLRLGSLGADVSISEIVYLLVVLLISLLLFSFGIVSVNSVIRSQRTLSKIKHADLERMEEQTFRLFGLLLIVFLAVFGFNLLLYNAQVDEKIRVILNSLFGFAASLLVLFAPQAIVIDGARIEHALHLSSSVLSRKPASVVAFLAFGALLVLLNGLVFTSLQGVYSYSTVVGFAFNSLFIIPFLEVLKAQIYLSKYSLI